jgi:ABC-type multidrug transport system fused ATPase/permease subunit
MKLKFRNNFWGYFKFYYSIIGNKFLVNLGLSISISFLDGLGLAMFIPLLQAVGEDGVVKDQGPGGTMRYFANAMRWFGLDMTITTILFFLVLLFSFKGLVKYFQLSYQVNLKHLFIKKVRFGLVDSLRSLSYKGFLTLDAGKIQNTLTSEVNRLFQSMNFYFNAAQSAVMLLTYVVLAFFANFQFALLVAVGAGLSNLIYKRIYIETQKASFGLSKKGNEFNGYLIQAIHHFKYLKSTNYFKTFSVRLKDVILKAEILNKKMGSYAAITQAGREPLIIIIVALVILIQVKWMGSSLSSIILSLLLFYRSLSFLMVIQNNWQSFIQSIGSMDAVATITAQMSEHKEVAGIQPYEGFTKAIELRDVSFYYGEVKILNNLNIKIPKNKTVAFVGESGAGKTTLANIIVGLISPDYGNLLLDGTDINQINLDSYRDSIGYISQEPVIFSDNIFNNITFWAARTPENVERFYKVVKLASLEKFIEMQPKKELTLLGDNGVLISGGQKQRISIARELYKKAEILILDEATSALDSETENVIKSNIEQLHGSYTMILIAHRLSTIKEVDTIYLLDKGSISASGTFTELLHQSERFKRMVQMQEI